MVLHQLSASANASANCISQVHQPIVSAKGKTSQADALSDRVHFSVVQLSVFKAMLRHNGM